MGSTAHGLYGADKTERAASRHATRAANAGNGSSIGRHLSTFEVSERQSLEPNACCRFGGYGGKLTG